MQRNIYFFIITVKVLQAYWSGLLYPLPGNLLDPGIKPTSLMSPALFFTTGTMLEAIMIKRNVVKM